MFHRARRRYYIFFAFTNFFEHDDDIAFSSFSISIEHDDDLAFFSFSQISFHQTHSLITINVCFCACSLDAIFFVFKNFAFRIFFSSKFSFAFSFQIEHFYFSFTMIDSFKKQTIKNDRRKNDFIDYSKLFKIEISSKRFIIIRQKRFNNSFFD